MLLAIIIQFSSNYSQTYRKHRAVKFSIGSGDGGIEIIESNLVCFTTDVILNNANGDIDIKDSKVCFYYSTYYYIV